MRYKLTEEELTTTVDLLLNKFEISTNFLNDLYGRQMKSSAEDILFGLKQIYIDKEHLCRMILIREGANFFSGGEAIKKELRKRVLDKLPDSVVKGLYAKYPDPSKNITTASYMRRPLAEKK